MSNDYYVGISFRLEDDWNEVSRRVDGLIEEIGGYDISSGAGFGVRDISFYVKGRPSEELQVRIKETVGSKLTSCECFSECERDEETDELLPGEFEDRVFDWVQESMLRGL